MSSALDMNASLLQAELGCSPLFARLLVARGLSDAASVERFLQPSLERDWLDPALIGGMEAGVARLQLALREGQRIAVFGDYDLDGISATAVMVRGLEALGATELRALLPERSAGGYGLSEQATAAIEASAPDLLVTVDNGITAAAAVARLRAAGIDVIVTDHHLPDPASLPGDAVLIDPQLDSDDLSPLSGAGVALKVIQALSIAEGRPELWKEWTDLATMGTIADIVPLLGENRALVTEGLARLRTHPNPGLRELVASVRNLDLSAITSERVSFSLAPRLNAAGRMGSPRVALDLLLCDDPDNCAALSQRLAQLNGLRRETEAELTAVVTAQVSKSFRPGQRLILAAGEGWHEGVRGIVASRLVDAFGAVAIVCGIEDGVASGSVRSVGSVDVHEALLACSAHLTQFGGHATAAGVTLPAAALEDFGADLAACLDKLPAEQFEPTAAVDLDCRLNELDWALAEEFERLEPFGEGMRKPVLSAAPVEVERAGLVGAGQEHLSFRARQGETSVKAIYFRAVDGERWVGQVTPARVSFTLEKDEFRGARGVQLGVVDLQPWDGGAEEGADGDGSGIRLRGTERSGDGAPKRKSDTVSSDAPSSAAPRPDADEFVLDLFAHADESFARRDYANIADAASFYTKLAGVSFAGRQELISQLLPADQLELRREPDNPHDTCAIAVIATRLRAQIGFLNRALCAELAPAIDEGAQYSAELEQVTGGEEGRSRGVNVLLTRVGADDDRAVSLAAQDSERARLEALPAAELDEALRKLFIGSGTLHAAQAETLDALSRGVNTLTVMATGRGKSLIFHLHAARLAIAQHRQSIFVFPLRALVADQAFHLEETFARIGLRVQVITGESSEAARTAAFEGLSAHAIDIVLTTPEFLSFHAREFAEAADVGFVVIDEAHHIGQARAGNRPAYTRLGEAIAELGSPTVLAVTATAGPEVAQRICEILGIKNRVLDPTVRENLQLSDVRGGEKRGIKLPFLTGETYSKENYILRLAQKGTKMVIYVNSRQKSVELARLIRSTLPEYAWQTAFYNAGLARDVRHEIERRFRDGKLSIIIATSAFGEGVNIPDIRDVVLYHFPYSDVEFNQMAGRAGRDGKPATIHLLFTETDARINDFILAAAAPARDSLAALYVALRDVAAGEGEGFVITNADLAELANDRLRAAGAFKKREVEGAGSGTRTRGTERSGDGAPRRKFATRSSDSHEEKKQLLALTEDSVSTGISVFRELGFVRTEGHSAARRITFTPSPYKLDLNQSVRYVEGLDQLDDFTAFKEWMLSATADELLTRFNRPILPEGTE